VDLINRIDPVHLELSVADPEALLPRIRRAAAIFMVRHTAEAIGDYCACPNHVQPTPSTARFSSPHGPYASHQRSSQIHYTPAGAASLGRIADVLARGESLEAHARSPRYRIHGEAD